MIAGTQTPAEPYGLIGLSDFDALDASIVAIVPAHPSARKPTTQ